MIKELAMKMKPMRIFLFAWVAIICAKQSFAVSQFEDQKVFKKIDHVFFTTAYSELVRNFLTKELGLIENWPSEPYDNGEGFSFVSNAINLRNINLELVTEVSVSAPQGIALEPKGSFNEALAALNNSSIPHFSLGAAQVFTYPNDYSKTTPFWIYSNLYLKSLPDRKGTLWAVEGLVPASTDIPYFNFMVKYNINTKAWKQDLRKRYKKRRGGKLGLVRVKNILIESKDPKIVTNYYNNLLDRNSKHPGIVVNQGTKERVVGLSLVVRNKKKAISYLRRINSLGVDENGAHFISHWTLEGAGIKLVITDR